MDGFDFPLVGLYGKDPRRCRKRGCQRPSSVMAPASGLSRVQSRDFHFFCLYRGVFYLHAELGLSTKLAVRTNRHIGYFGEPDCFYKCRRPGGTIFLTPLPVRGSVFDGALTLFTKFSNRKGSLRSPMKKFYSHFDYIVAGELAFVRKKEFIIQQYYKKTNHASHSCFSD